MHQGILVGVQYHVSKVIGNTYAFIKIVLQLQYIGIVMPCLDIVKY